MKRFNPALTEEEKALALKIEKEWKENPKLLPRVHPRYQLGPALIILRHHIVSRK